jgi:hypothetical protein
MASGCLLSLSGSMRILAMQLAMLQLVIVENEDKAAAEYPKAVDKHAEAGKRSPATLPPAPALKPLPATASASTVSRA